MWTRTRSSTVLSLSYFIPPQQVLLIITIISYFHHFFFFQNDTSVIAKLVAKFIIDFFYNKKHCEEVIFSRLVKLTNINVRAPRLLFIHAEGLINSADAFTVNIELVTIKFLKSGTKHLHNFLLLQLLPCK